MLILSNQLESSQIFPPGYKTGLQEFNRGRGGSGFAAEVVDDEADEEEEEGSEHDPQCDLEHHGYLGGAGAGLISRRKLKNSDLVERISMSFSDKISS